MASQYDEIDLWFTESGDYQIFEGDLKDTSEDGLRSIVQDFISVCKSVTNDWKLLPNSAANAADSVGRPNLPETARLLHDRLRVALISNTPVLEEDLSITIFPVAREEVLVVLRINALPSPYNRLGRGEVLVIELVYNYEEQGTFVLNASSTTIYDVG